MSELKEKKTRVKMPSQPADTRRKNFKEVPLGYSPEQAQDEASRCLQCKKQPCVAGCPVNVNIPAFIKLINDGRFSDAAYKIKETNILPAVCGRVCPQESQCEARCVLSKKNEAVAIGNLERFAADYERENYNQIKIPGVIKTGKKVAVVGSGPAGITVAADLITKGVDVTIFEAFHQAGGVLVYGIPEFRLPKSIVADEIKYLLDLGVKLELNTVVGNTVSIDELIEEHGFDAVFIGVGSGLPMFMGIPGENLGGIYSANDYLTRNNLMKAFRFPEYDTPVIKGKHVTVIGGGNVAMDAARTALRLGSDDVKIVYRRSMSELPARVEEVKHAQEEGIEFLMLTNPIEFVSTNNMSVEQIKCIKMELGELDSSGRRSPVPIPGSDFYIDTDLVVVAIGSRANPLLTNTIKDMELNKWGYIKASETGKTTKDKVWAGGDIVTGSATVIEAMGAGRIAASDILKSL